MASGLHRPLSGGHLRLARLPEKIEKGHRHPKEGHRPYPSPPG